MNKHIITALTLAALSVPGLVFAQTAPRATQAAAPAVTNQANLPATAAPAASDKNIKDRVGNVISALQRYTEVLSMAITRVSEQSAKFKTLGGDVSAANVDIAAAKAKLDTVKKDITDLQNMTNTTNLLDRTKTQAVRDQVTKTVSDIRACRDSILSGVQKLKAVTVKKPATTVPQP
jgi:DNA repair ATPase RecN